MQPRDGWGPLLMVRGAYIGSPWTAASLLLGKTLLGGRPRCCPVAGFSCRAFTRSASHWRNRQSVTFPPSCLVTPGGNPLLARNPLLYAAKTQTPSPHTYTAHVDGRGRKYPQPRPVKVLVARMEKRNRDNLKPILICFCSPLTFRKSSPNRRRIFDEPRLDADTPSGCGDQHLVTMALGWVGRLPFPISDFEAV